MAAMACMPPAVASVDTCPLRQAARSRSFRHVGGKCETILTSGNRNGQLRTSVQCQTATSATIPDTRAHGLIYIVQSPWLQTTAFSWTANRSQLCRNNKMAFSYGYCPHSLSVVRGKSHDVHRSRQNSCFQKLKKFLHSPGFRFLLFPMPTLHGGQHRYQNFLHNPAQHGLLLRYGQ